MIMYCLCFINLPSKSYGDSWFGMELNGVRVLQYFGSLSMYMYMLDYE